jgi:hypothetical protein
LDQPAVRRIWLQKVYGDVIVDRRWRVAFDPSAILRPRPASTIDEESIGFLLRSRDWDMNGPRRS